MSLKWTQQEDNLLRQLSAIGLTSAAIYKNYRDVLKGRSQSAIQQRLTYLNKPPEERRKEDMASFDNADMIEAAINKSADRICNRLDNIANALARVCRSLEDAIQQTEKNDERCLRVLEEIKANGTLAQGTQQSIKHELQKFVYRKSKNG